MANDQIESAAFQDAALASERLRIFGLLGFLSLFIVVSLVRVFVVRTA